MPGMPGITRFRFCAFRIPQNKSVAPGVFLQPAGGIGLRLALTGLGKIFVDQVESQAQFMFTASRRGNSLRDFRLGSFRRL